jgi:hypothetical protein
MLLKKTAGIGRNLTRIVILAVLAVPLLACSTPGLVRQHDGMKVLSAGPVGTTVYWIKDSSTPTLVVKSSKGFGHAKLRLPAAMPNGLVIEFPGLQSMEELVLENGRQQLVCTGGQAERVDCRWGEEWPLGEVRRYPTGMTFEVSPRPFTKAEKWTLHWVDFWR